MCQQKHLHLQLTLTWVACCNMHFLNESLHAYARPKHTLWSPHHKTGKQLDRL